MRLLRVEVFFRLSQETDETRILYLLRCDRWVSLYNHICSCHSLSCSRMLMGYRAGAAGGRPLRRNGAAQLRTARVPIRPIGSAFTLYLPCTVLPSMRSEHRVLSFARAG